jgi:hypothetical protein
MLNNNSSLSQLQVRLQLTCFQLQVGLQLREKCSEFVLSASGGRSRLLLPSCKWGCNSEINDLIFLFGKWWSLRTLVVQLQVGLQLIEKFSLLQVVVAIDSCCPVVSGVATDVLLSSCKWSCNLEINALESVLTLNFYVCHTCKWGRNWSLLPSCKWSCNREKNALNLSYLQVVVVTDSYCLVASGVATLR